MNYNGVILVGAGPGDPELLTVKALRAIERADIIVYDRLVSEEIMALIPRGVPKIYAGKSCKHKAMPQEEINQLLVTLSKKYARVVRLKGGDPFMFGRGGEEMEALRAAKVPHEIIPGITSAQGCAAAAGIPLTHRGLAGSVRFITGHRQDATSAPLELNWPSLADPDTTLVIYMGLVNIAEIVKNLVAHGVASDTPATIIERGTTPQQRVFTARLSALPATVEAEKVQSPSLIIIGKVAALADMADAGYDFAQKYVRVNRNRRT
ncbi:MAG: uroporphyrinogen-III C-methyltransferase [Alphaproteobacteria bacterium]|nr:uroporphyrinogen-III C-methyltransferase [Alphaproteobacteria bacterium]